MAYGKRVLRTLTVILFVVCVWLVIPGSKARRSAGVELIAIGTLTLVVGVITFRSLYLVAGPLVSPAIIQIKSFLSRRGESGGR